MVEGLRRDAENLEFWHSDLFKMNIQPNQIEESSLGDLCGGGTPGPIPNPEVKTASADGTWWETAWESRSLPRGFLRIMKTIRAENAR